MIILKEIGNIKIHLFLYTGLFIVSYILFVRLILKKLPKYLSPELNLISKIIFVEILLGFVILFFMTFRKYLEDKKYYLPTSSQNKYFLFLKNQIHNINHLITTSLHTVHYKLILPWASDYIEYLGRLIVNYIPYSKVYYLIIIFNIIPKFSVMTIFLIDVFYFHELNFFYKVASILLIPLIFQYLCFAINNDALEGIYDCDNYLVITNRQTKEDITATEYFNIRSKHLLQYISEFDFSQYQYTFHNSFLNQIETNPNVNLKATLGEFMSKINSLIDIASYTLFLDLWKDINLLKFYLILYFGYICGWVYCLYLIF